MSIVALTNSSSPVTVERATADSDPYSRETQLNGLALNFDAHDHTSAKNLGVGRVQTGTAPAASGQVRANGDAWQWWGATAGAVRTALDLEGAQTVSGQKTFSSTLILTPGAGVPAVTATGLVQTQGNSGAGSAGFLFGDRSLGVAAKNFVLYADGGPWYMTESGVGNILGGNSTTLNPSVDNRSSLGVPSVRWSIVYSNTGTISTSSAAVKEGITPLSPAECYQAAKDVRWFDFRYAPPAYQEPKPVEGEEAETREQRLDASKAAHARMLVETAPARHQRGFVYPAGADTKDEAGGTLPPVPDLFGLSDRESTTPQADLATLGCALQHVIARLEALEGAGA